MRNLYVEGKIVAPHCLNQDNYYLLQMENPDKSYTTVLFNGDCEICTKEICVYQTYGADKGLPIDFKDINAIDLARFGLTRDETARQLHVIKNSELFKGVKAFVVLWSEMPRYRFLARLFSLPGVTDLAQFFYYHVIARFLYARDIKRLKS